ncbi:hypothetical protein [Xanthobacter autotrophicus]|uniref:hypothetical protein n=1 Tax=Xanthobacter autotrophicus TaxID=280 RepID=UPI0037290ADC
MASEMQERIARAIYEDRNGHGCVMWSRRGRADRAPYLSDALAAMKAMLEPTPAMLEAAEWAAEDGALLDFDRDDFRLTFTAGISHEIAAAEEARRDQD